jgi:hypothetical protein
MWRVGLVVSIAMAILSLVASVALGAVTPGWECVPWTAGQAVVSGGTGASPSCGSGTSAVLAPTYVSAGVDGRPTVEFSAVNVQVVSGTGSTSGTVNGEGNLIVGYAEHTSGHSQAGSNNLVVGSENGWKSYGAIVGGFKNQAIGKYATAVGYGNSAPGAYSLAAGEANTAAGTGSAVTGGAHNTAQGSPSSVTGGDYNLASGAFATVAGGCENLAGGGSPLSGSCTTGAQSVLGGFENTASGLESTVSGGESNTAGATASSVLGGHATNASTPCQAIPAAPGTC